MKLMLTCAALLAFMWTSALGQPWTYDFGTGTGSWTSGASTTFLPAPQANGGTAARVRVGTGGGSFNLENPGLTFLGSNTELRSVAPTSTSINKFSIYDYSTAAKVFYTKYTILMGDNSGGSTAGSGVWYFYQGDGLLFSDNNNISGNLTQGYAILRFTYGSSGAITLAYRDGSVWTNLTSPSPLPLVQGTVYSIEIYGNNTTSSQTYERSGAQSLAADKWDLWINSVLVGNDLNSGPLANDVNIDSWMFGGENSTGNVANIFLDDFEYSNSLPAAAAAPDSSAVVSGASGSPNVPCVSYQAADITSSNAFRAWDFTIREGVNNPTGDTDPTIIDSLKIVKGALDSTGNWSSVIRRAALYTGTTEKQEVGVFGDTIKFTNIMVADGADSAYSLYLTFMWAYPDNKQLQFKLTNATIFTAASGSSPMAAFACSSGTAADSNRVEVTATELGFSTQPPATTPVNTNFGAAVEAVDANGNRDLDATASVTLGEDGAGNLSSATGLIQNLASGIFSWTDLQYDQAGTGIHLVTANIGGLTNATSSAFDVTSVSGTKVAAGDSAEAASISSLYDSQAEAVLNFDFTVTDDGSTPGTDVLPTLIDTVVIYQGSGNEISAWYQAIAGALLLDNSGNSFLGTIGYSIIRFSNIPTSSGGLGYVADNATKHYRLKVWLNSDMGYLRDTIDGLNLAFRVNRSCFKTLATGSSVFAAGDGENVESGSANNEISVTASDVRFAYQPTAPIYRSTAFRADVEAVDANGNRDRHAANSVTLTRIAGTGTLSSSAGLTQSLSSGLYSWIDLLYDVSETGVRIEAASGGWADTCNSFAVIESEPTVQASGIAFSAVGETLMTVSWTPGNGAGRILLAKAGQTVSHPPVDGQGYSASSTFGLGSQIGTNNFVVYSGSGSSVTVTGLSPVTRYFFALYEYNGTNTTANYLTAGPDTGSQLTNAALAVGDFQSKADGNWSSAVTWDQWDGSAWMPAASTPTASNTVYIRGADSVTLDANGACKNLILYNASNGMRLSLNSACTLLVSGTLTSGGGLPSSALIKGAGLVKFVGGSRPLFGSTWSANPPYWRFEVALDPGAVGTASSAVKAGQIIISSGTFTVGTSSSHDLRPDSGSTGTGSLRVASGATLAVLGNISRTGTATTQCALVDVNGTLKIGGRNISATNININNGGKLVSTRNETPRGHVVTGTLSYASGSTLEYNSGTSDFVQATGGELTAEVHNLLIKNPAGDSLKSNVTVNGALSCQQGFLYTGNYFATLAAEAILTESNSSNVQGTIQLTRALSQSIPDTFNGLGLRITAIGAAPGATTVIRTTGRHYGVGGNQSINRSFSISPATNSGLNAAMVFRYRESELNGLAESELGLFRSANNGASWDSLGGFVDPGANTLTLTGIQSFSLWTAGRAGVPLAVELAGFSALAAEWAITLSWRTESENGSYQWIVERSDAESGPFVELGRVAAAGNSQVPRDYTWSDIAVREGKTYYYRIGELGLDGRIAYFGPVSCKLGRGRPQAALVLGCAPNPFWQMTTIRYQIAEPGKMSLKIYNISGQLVRRIEQGLLAPGYYQVRWDGADDNGTRLSAGVYLYRISIGGRQFGGKVQLVR